MTKTFREHPQRHLIRVMSSHDLTNKKTMTKTNTMKNTKTKTMTKTFREHLQRAVLETCDLRLLYICLTLPTKLCFKSLEVSVNI